LKAIILFLKESQGKNLGLEKNLSLFIKKIFFQAKRATERTFLGKKVKKASNTCFMGCKLRFLLVFAWFC
jgi:hypothetical protein